MCRVPRIASMLLLLLTSFSSLTAGEGNLVLCLALDGHVALESGLGHCVEGAPVAEPVASEPGPRSGSTFDDCCGPCADVPLGVTTFVATAASRHEVSVDSAISFAAFAAPPLLLPSLADRRMREPNDRRPPPRRVSTPSQLRC